MLLTSLFVAATWSELEEASVMKKEYSKSVQVVGGHTPLMIRWRRQHTLVCFSCLFGFLFGHQLLDWHEHFTSVHIHMYSLTITLTSSIDFCRKLQLEELHLGALSKKFFSGKQQSP